MTAPAAAFLDRDGTINVKAPEGEYVETPEEVVLLPGAAAAIRVLNEAGVSVVVVTNQRGIALGRMTEDDLEAVHARLASLLAAEGARVDAWYHCPHDRGECSCRKPGTAMLERAAREHGIELRRSVMIGDSESDVEAGRRVGARTVRLAPSGAAAAGGAASASAASGAGGPAGAVPSAADAVLPSLLDAVRWALR
ncbi:MAG TPA: HAD family hydrolase [Solirubrobacteraceae bacterium]|jgi:D-glycero-D-manno-heptose 1,7-bisphosphate phosphatase|nr:HAD family hydrolase [Solirubrobacteraceae bacterium]